MTLHDRQELNFVNFNTIFLQPMYRLLEASLQMTASRTRSGNLARASLLEAICLAALGEAVQFYPARTALLVSQAVARQFSDQGAFLADWGYLFDREWLMYINKTGDRPLPARTDEPIGYDTFETCLLHVTNLARSAAVPVTVGVLNFDLSDEVEEYLRRPVSMDEIAEVTASEEGIDEKSGDIALAAVYIGFGHLTEFLDAFVNLQHPHTLRTDGRTAGAIAEAFARLLRWRFFQVETNSDLKTLLTVRYLDCLGVGDEDQRAQFRFYLESILERWSGMQGPMLSATTAN